uniref:Uncharacterized protein n=1 Tax=Ditylenchus dipsaci TaxID=166011 RepID=A0A915DHK3_9BILA
MEIKFKPMEQAKPIFAQYYVWSASFGSIFTYNLYLALGRTQYYSRTVEEVFGWNEPDHSGPLLCTDSTIELFHKWPWILQGLLVKDYPLHQFHVELDYQTTSKQGIFFTIVAESPFKHTFFVLDAKFSEGILQLQLFGSSNNTLIEQAPTSIKSEFLKNIRVV